MTGAFGSAAGRVGLSAGEAVVLVLLAVVPFLNGLASDFTYDDGPIIRDNGRLDSPESLPRIFATHYFGGGASTATAYRPVVLLTFALEKWIHGSRPWAFRAVNILLHAGVTLLLAGWWLRIGVARAPAIAGASLFAVAAIHVEAVTSIVGRAETLAALLVLLSVRLWRESLPPGGSFRRAAYAGALASFLAAVFVKESAVVAPALVLLGETFVAARAGTPLAAALTRRRALAFAGFLVPVVLLFAARRAVLDGFLMSREAGGFELENPLASMPPLLRAASATGLLFRYAAKTLVPLGLAADHSGGALAFPSSLRDPGAFLPPVVLVVALVGSLALRRRRPEVPFGLFLFVGAILPTANVLFPTGTVYADRLAYLPSAGIFLATAALLLRPGAASLGPAAGPVLALIASLQAALASGRNAVWENDATLYADMVAKAPGSAKARYNLAYVLSRQGRKEEALQHLRVAVAEHPIYHDAWALEGKVLADMGRPAEAEQAFRRAVAIHSTHELGLWGLAMAIEAQGRSGEALAALDGDARLLPSSYPVAYHRARLLGKSGNIAKAEREARRAAVVSDRAAPALKLRAGFLRQQGKDAEAAELEREADGKGAGKGAGKAVRGR